MVPIIYSNVLFWLFLHPNFLRLLRFFQPCTFKRLKEESVGAGETSYSCSTHAITVLYAGCRGWWGQLVSGWDYKPSMSPLTNLVTWNLRRFLICGSLITDVNWSQVVQSGARPVDGLWVGRTATVCRWTVYVFNSLNPGKAEVLYNPLGGAWSLSTPLSASSAAVYMNQLCSPVSARYSPLQPACLPFNSIFPCGEKSPGLTYVCPLEPASLDLCSSHTVSSLLQHTTCTCVHIKAFCP